MHGIHTHVHLKDLDLILDFENMCKTCPACYFNQVVQTDECIRANRMNTMSHRAQYRRDAQAAYQQKMLAAHNGKGDYPKIRTFSNTENSTNSVFKDIEAAERL